MNEPQLARAGHLRSVRWPAAGVLLASALAACSQADEPALMVEARSALQQLASEPVSTRFDDSGMVILRSQGLVCGGRVDFRDESGRFKGFQPYYFDRERGVALPDHDPALYAALMRECHRAIG